MSDGWLVIELSENWRLDEKLDFIQNIDMFTDRLTGRGLIIKMYLDIVTKPFLAFIFWYISAPVTHLAANTEIILW